LTFFGYLPETYPSWGQLTRRPAGPLNGSKLPCPSACLRPLTAWSQSLAWSSRSRHDFAQVVN